MTHMTQNSDDVRTKVRERYAKAAKVEGRIRELLKSGCCDSDYSDTELSRIPLESFLGMGSGNPVRHADLQPGEIVVDLGSGAGIDVFLAADQVGLQGRAIGIDMTPEMVERARSAADKSGVTNVEFHEAMIEQLRLADEKADVMLSNCVVNLTPDKSAVFREAFRVLKPGGRLVISDIVQERPLQMMEDDCGCIATATVRKDYLETIRAAGFANIQILEDRPWLRSSSGVDASTITLRAVKPKKEVNK